MTTNVLAAEELGKVYNSGGTPFAALRSVSFSVGAGELLALMGPSGSGKSTILNICGLIDSPSSGRLRFLDEELTAASERRRTEVRRQKVGFIFQQFNLVPVLNIAENVEYPLRLLGVGAGERKRRVSALLERLGIGACARLLPDKISGGQRQRAAIARALVCQQPLVICDEPTASLDSKNAEEVIVLLEQMSKEYGTAFLVATHDERMSSRCERVLRLQDGVISNESDQVN